MAEYVHRHTELMLPELEQLQQANLFSVKEVKAIIKKRTAHEYKLVRRTKDKNDFLAYVQYEIYLLALIHKRRQRENYYFKKDEIEYAIVSRIHGLFKQMTFRWPHDMKLWMSHAQFCIKWKKKTQLSKLCTKLLQIHGNKPKLWILAAKWESECGESTEKCRSIFLQAIKAFPQNTHLWLEYFRAELLFAEKLWKRLNILGSVSQETLLAELEPDEALLLTGEAAKIVYRNAIKSIPDDVAFHIKFLEIVSLFLLSSYAATILKEVQQNLLALHKDEPKVQSVIAQLHLNPNIGVPYGDNPVKKQIHRERTCYQKFDNCVNKLDCAEMWMEYFDLTLKLRNKGVSTGSPSERQTIEEHRTNKFLQVARVVHGKKILTPSKYLAYVDVLLGLGSISVACQILDEAIENNQEPSLVLKQLQLAMMTSSSGDSDSVDLELLFEKAMSSAAQMSAREQQVLAEMWMQHLILSGDDARARAALIKLLASCGRQSTIGAQELFLMWHAGKHGVESAYKIFESAIRGTRTPSLEQYRCMLNILKSSPNSKNVARCYELALRDYGSEDVELWLDYIRHLAEGDGPEVTEIGKIYWRALKTLRPDYAEKFVTGYARSNNVTPLQSENS